MKPVPSVTAVLLGIASAESADQGMGINRSASFFGQFSFAQKLELIGSEIERS